MSEPRQTTRQQIAAHLREQPAPASALAREFEIEAAEALGHVEHIARSLDGTDEELLVAPPECVACGFDGFDDLLNRPSRCPDCKSETVEEPVFRVE